MDYPATSFFADPMFWLILLSPIWLAVLIRMLPIQGPRKSFVSLIIFVNIVPYVAFAAWLGDALDPLFAAAFFLIFGVVGLMVLTIVPFLIMSSASIILNHDGIEES